MQTVHKRLARILCDTLARRASRLAILLILTTATLAQGQQPAPAWTKTRQTHWHKYINSAYGFSIGYPDPYRPVPLPPPNAGDKYRTWDKRLLLLQRSDDPNARIWITLDRRHFDLSTISHYHSQTGMDPDWPPTGPTIGHHTFYFYGAGGGGANYPDSYFVELRGKILDIYFDGPYEGKSPNKETSSLEPKILNTFRVR